jgi:hypothetical protein
MRVYIFRIHPFWRLFWVVILLWVAATCFGTGVGGMFVMGVLFSGIAGFISYGLLRRFWAYLHTWG